MTPNQFAALAVLAFAVLVLAGAIVAEIEAYRERRTIAARLERITRQ